MEPPDPSFADEFNVPQEYAVLAFDLRRAAVSLPFQVHHLKVLVEAGLVAFSSACFEFADEDMQSNDVTTLCSTGSQQGVDVPDTVNTVDHCCANVERADVSSSSRDLALANLCFLRMGFLSARFPRRLFRANAPHLLLSSRCFLPRFLPSFFRRVGYRPPTTPRLLHRRHFCLLAHALRAFLLSSLRVPCFPRRRCPNFATAGTVAAGNDLAWSGFISASRLYLD